MARASKKKPKTVPPQAPDAAELAASDNEEEKESKESVKDVFPPVLFSNGISAGNNAMVLAPATTSSIIGSTNMVDTSNKTQRQQQKFKTNTLIGPPQQQPHAALSEEYAKLWLHNFAANASLYPHHFPRHVFRLLGSITRWVDQPPPLTKTTKSKTPHQYMPRQKNPPPQKGKEEEEEENAKPAKKKRKVGIRKMTQHMAKREFWTELEDGLVDVVDADARIDAIWQSWLSLSHDATVQSKNAATDGWDLADGSLVDANDKQYVSIPTLLRWMERESVADRHAQEHCTLYHGLKHIPVNTKAILDALLDLSSPEGLYMVPLIMPFAIVTKETAKIESLPAAPSMMTTTTTTSWKISIAVYAHRLLPEVMSSGPLHTVMCALDPGSYKCLQPIHLPPVSSEIVFESCPYPVVVMDGHVVDAKDDDEEKAVAPVDVDDASDDSTARASTKNKKKVPKIKKASLVPEPTRDEQSISAFTTKGLLKLLESRGNDTSNWPDLQTKILPHLKLQLMLHQEHAICWMVQMESLGGFGINSVLWETREFLDGGKYYYSPALGQIRLRPPPVMKGGLLCDEMGLGKTIEVLGLVLATLEDLKLEAAEPPEDDGFSLPAWHATLIIVPPALVSQWLDEIRKTTGDSLVVKFFDFQTAAFFPRSSKLTTAPNTSPDIVVTTYNALEKPASAKILSSKAWGRVVLDEMQEIRQSTGTIARNCEGLACNRRWMLSGTPLFEGIDDLRGELNFLRLEPFAAALEDGFFNFAIGDRWEHRDVTAYETIRVLGLFILRRSKSMTIRATGAPILGLKPLTVEFVPIPQSLSERALYCFLEYVLAQELRGDASNARTSRGLCLRLLREFCISTTLLNGGIGVSSQLRALDSLLVDQARRNFAPIATGEEARSGPCFSCDEAIRYLSVAQEATRSGENEVSFMRLGLGQGMARRVRAELTTIEEQLQLANDKLTKATTENAMLKRKRAIALWHMALELVTTGRCPLHKPSKYSSIWRWRHIIACLKPLPEDASSLPSLLIRGWRPSQRFTERDLFRKHPEFFWAHPFCLELKGIPVEVETKEVSNAIVHALSDAEQGCTSVDDFVPHQRFRLEKGPLPFKSTWNAYLQFNNLRDVERLHQMSLRKKGIQLPSAKPIPRVETSKEEAKERLDNATAAYTIHPCAAKHADVRTAKKELEQAKYGLRIVDEQRTDNLHVSIVSAVASRRSLQLTSRQHLLTMIKKERHNCTDFIFQNNQTIDTCSERIEKLKFAATLGVTREVEAMSAFEILDALASGQAEKTQCPICLGQLGESNNEYDEDDGPGVVAMTKCGHLYCASCLEDYMLQTPTANRRLPCPSCRKQIHPDDIMRVDPSQTSERDLLLERRKTAKEVVKAAAQLLETSNGQLAPNMWEQLFLSVDLPEGANDSLDRHFPSIPRDVAAHFRAATHMPLNCNRQMRCYQEEGKQEELLYSSRVQALLGDLPKAERSVVFSSSNACIRHLHVVLENEGIGCRVLFSGQSVEDSERAVSDWKCSVAGKGGESLPLPVLLVQSGAAASGLTLTAACKVFLMEPFVRYEEEQQAYARCHRYGQENPVHVKCYYAPVSVESRLLEWRKVAESASCTTPVEGSGNRLVSTNPKIVYSSILKDGESDQDEDDQDLDGDDHVDSDQTEFLLGLTG